MWVNHHHMMHLPSTPNAPSSGEQQPAFWMSLIPFVTAYWGRRTARPSLWPSTGLDLTFCSAGFTLLRYLVTADPHAMQCARETAADPQSLWSLPAVCLLVPTGLCAHLAVFFIFY